MTSEHNQEVLFNSFVSSRTRSAATSSSMNPIASQSFLAPSMPLFIARSTPCVHLLFLRSLLTLCPLSKRLKNTTIFNRNQDVDDAFGDEMNQYYSQDDESDQGFSLRD